MKFLCYFGLHKYEWKWGRHSPTDIEWCGCVRCGRSFIPYEHVKDILVQKRDVIVQLRRQNELLCQLQRLPQNVDDDISKAREEVRSLQSTIDTLYEQKRDLLKQHQEDARIWQIQRHQLLSQLDLVQRDRDAYMQMYAEATGGVTRVAPLLKKDDHD